VKVVGCEGTGPLPRTGPFPFSGRAFPPRQPPKRILSSEKSVTHAFYGRVHNWITLCRVGWPGRWPSGEPTRLRPRWGGAFPPRGGRNERVRARAGSAWLCERSFPYPPSHPSGGRAGGVPFRDAGHKRQDERKGWLSLALRNIVSRPLGHSSDFVSVANVGKRKESRRKGQLGLVLGKIVSLTLTPAGRRVPRAGPPPPAASARHSPAATGPPSHRTLVRWPAWLEPGPFYCEVSPVRSYYTRRNGPRGPMGADPSPWNNPGKNKNPAGEVSLATGLWEGDRCP
jgi:hypothetical protein